MPALPAPGAMARVGGRERRGPRSPASPTGGAGVPGFGDAAARMVIVGLAPAAHGANRTGRMFTGDRSGDWLFAALYRAGYASQPTSTDRHDGLVLRDAYITASVHCAPPANKPTPGERATCAPYLVRELDLLGGPAGHCGPGPVRLPERGGRPRPAAPAEVRPPGRIRPAGRSHPPVLVPPSQQNTFTGVLTEPMFDAVFARAREIGDQAPRS